MKSRRRRNRKTQSNVLGGALFLVSVLLMGSMFYLSRTAGAGREKDARGCSTTGPSAIHAVLFDKTDTLTDLQRASIRTDIENWILDLPPNNLVELYAIDPNGDIILRPIVSACSREQGADVDEWTHNKRLVEKHWEEQFHAPLASKLDEMLLTNPRDSSPILESLQALGVVAFRRHEALEIPRHLILISDLLQNSGGYSQYSGPSTFADFRKSAQYLKTRAELQGVKAEVWYVRRDGAQRAQGRTHVLFWEEYFRDAGAELTRVKSVEG